MPWDIVDYKQYQLRMQNGMKREFEENSQWIYCVEDGHKFFGPVSERMLQVEYKRLTSTFDSIQKEGFYNYEKLRGVLLINQDTIKVDIIGGMHRLSALLALDYDAIPVYIEMNKNRIIKNEECKNWHHVKSGLYNEEQALEIFDINFAL